MLIKQNEERLITSPELSRKFDRINNEEIQHAIEHNARLTCSELAYVALLNAAE